MSAPRLAGLDSKNPTPLYHQIYLDFRHKIRLGILKDGLCLPSEAVIAKEFGVSRITVKRAMNELADEGLVSRNRGRGTTVSFQASEQPRSDGFAGLMESIQTIAATTTVEVLSFAYVTPPAEIAASLALPHTELTQRAERRRSREGEPFSYIVSYVPETIGRGWDEASLSANPILKLIEDSGRRIASARQQVTAEAANPLVAQSLRLPTGAPLLKVTRLVSDDAGQPIEYIEVLYRPDMYHLEMDLARNEDDQGHRVWSAVS